VNLQQPADLGTTAPLSRFATRVVLAFTCTAMPSICRISRLIYPNLFGHLPLQHLEPQPPFPAVIAAAD
jgi:hypothetical protein